MPRTVSYTHLANADLQDSTAKLKALDAAIREKKELQTQVLAYAKTKPARDGLKAQKTEKARSTYRERYESDFIIADAATRYFRAHGVSKLPSHKAVSYTHLARKAGRGHPLP